jgi:hypothetical protein
VNRCITECHLGKYVPSCFTRANRSSRRNGIRTLVRLFRSFVDAYPRAFSHSLVTKSRRQTKSGSLPSVVVSSICESTEDEIQDDISGFPGDSPRRDSFSFSFARVLIGCTLVLRVGIYRNSNVVTPVVSVPVGILIARRRFLDARPIRQLVTCDDVTA